MSHSSKSRKLIAPNDVTEIRGHRLKGTELQYQVAGLPGQGTNWVNADFVTRTDLIERYEAAREAPKDSGRARRISEILGVCQGEKELMYVIKFADSEAPELVSKSFILRRCSKLLLAYYENHIVFDNDTA